MGGNLSVFTEITTNLRDRAHATKSLEQLIMPISILPELEPLLTIKIYRSQLNQAAAAILSDRWVQETAIDLEAQISQDVITQAIVNILEDSLQDMFEDWNGDDWLRNPEYGKRLREEIKSLADNHLVSAFQQAA
jgi:hypothetical protein